MPVTEETLQERCGKIDSGKIWPQLLITFAGTLISLFEK